MGYIRMENYTYQDVLSIHHTLLELGAPIRTIKHKKFAEWWVKHEDLQAAQALMRIKQDAV